MVLAPLTLWRPRTLDSYVAWKVCSKTWPRVTVPSDCLCVAPTTIFDQSHKQLFLNSFAHSGVCSVPQENDYPLAHSVQSLMVTLVIRFAASRSHMAFRIERSWRMALMVLGLPRCTLAVSQPIA